MSDNWKTVTFSLTVDEVAQALGTTSAGVVNLMMAGALGFYVRPSGEKRRTLPLADVRFDPADVEDYRDRKPVVEVKAAVAVLDNLRAYLDVNWPPLSSPDAALSRGMPLQARDRAYVRVETLVKFAESAGAPMAAQMTRTTEEVLKSIGAVRQRGLRPEDGSRQRWEVWLRLPDAVWNGKDDPALEEFLRPRGALREDESVVLPPDGTGPVVEQVLPSDGDMWN